MNGVYIFIRASVFGKIEEQLKIIELNCPHRDTRNIIGQCPKFGRYYILVNDHFKNKMREFESKPIDITKTPSDFARSCDFCTERELNHLTNAVESGLRQRTCPACHKEILSNSGL